MQVMVVVSLVEVGPRWLAVTELGGIKIRGAPAAKPDGALKALFWKLSGNGPQSGAAFDEEAELGLQLALTGTTLEAEITRQSTQALAAHPDGDEEDAE